MRRVEWFYFRDDEEILARDAIRAAALMRITQALEESRTSRISFLCKISRFVVGRQQLVCSLTVIRMLRFLSPIMSQSIL